MSNFYVHQEKNKQKTWFLMISFVSIVVALGWFLSYYFNDVGILYIAVAVSIGMNVWAYWFSHKTVLRMTRAKELEYSRNPELHRVVENLAITAGLPKPKIYLVEDQAPNAFATGRDKEHAVIAVTTGLLDILEPVELEGVIAHELSHIGNNDMLISTVTAVLVGVIAMISDLLLRSSLVGRGDNRGNPLVLIGGIAIAIVMPLVATVLKLAISRKREYLADATGAMFTRYPEGLASALEKINRSGVGMRSANNATAHLFIANPFGEEKKKKFLHKMFLTHPPAEERIAALRGMDK